MKTQEKMSISIYCDDVVITFDVPSNERLKIETDFLKSAMQKQFGAHSDQKTTPEPICYFLSRDHYNDYLALRRTLQGQIPTVSP